MQIGQSVLDVAVRDQHLIHVRPDDLPVLRLRGLEIRSEAAALKDGSRQTFGDRPEAAPPVEQALDGPAFEAGGTRQPERRVEVCRRDTDLRVGRHNILLGLGDIGPFQEDARRQPRGHSGRSALAQRIRRDREG